MRNQQVETPPPAWILCRKFHETPVPNAAVLEQWAAQGRVEPDDYLFNPLLDTCVQARDLPELRAFFRQVNVRRVKTVSGILSGVVVVLTILLTTGCSVRRIAVNRFGDTIAEGGSTFAADDDPELVGSALPFTLKLIESLLAESPDHAALLVAAARGFTQYANGWVEPAGEGSEERAVRLYLRARDYGLRALALQHRDFRARLVSDPRAAAGLLGERDVPAIYWTATAWGLAISHSKDDPELLADLPIVDALIARAQQLDPGFDHGAIDTFLIAYEGARAGVSNMAETSAREHFRSAVERSGGRSAAPFVMAAEALAVAAQDRGEFESLLNTALSIDPDETPEWRLANILTQRRARWLLDHADELFVATTPESEDNHP